MNYAGYQNYNNYSGMQPPYMAMQPQQPQQPMIKPNTLQYASEDEIRAYILPQNSQVLAMDRDKPLFYIKSTDEFGRSTMNVYKFEKITPQTQAQPQLPDMSAYATQEDFKPIIERLERLEKAVKNEPRPAKETK